MSKDKDDVGYKKPPKKTQFKKGQSGNPKGRPKKSKAEHDFISLAINVLNEEIYISEGGKKRPVSKKEALLRSLYNKALGGDRNSLNLLLSLITKNIIPEEKRVIEKQEKAKIVDDYQPKDAMEAMRMYKELMNSL